MTYRPALTLLFLAGLPTALWADDYAASLDFARKITLGFPVSGNVERVDITAGQAVKAGQALAALDSLPYRAAEIEAQSRLTIAATENTQAQRDYRLAKELYDRTVLASVELEDAKLKAERSAARRRQADAGLSKATYELANTKITAPFDAWVLDVFIQERQTVVSELGAQPAAVLAERGRYLAYAHVPGSLLASLGIGQAAKVQVAGSVYDGRIAWIAMQPSNAKGGDDARYKVGVEFYAHETRLHAGQAAGVTLP